MGFDKFDYEHRFLPKAKREELRKQQEQKQLNYPTTAQSLYFSLHRVKK